LQLFARHWPTYKKIWGWSRVTDSPPPSSYIREIKAWLCVSASQHFFGRRGRQTKIYDHPRCFIHKVLAAYSYGSALLFQLLHNYSLWWYTYSIHVFIWSIITQMQFQPVNGSPWARRIWQTVMNTACQDPGGMDSQAVACTRPLISDSTGQQIVVKPRASTRLQRLGLWPHAYRHDWR